MKKVLTAALFLGIGVSVFAQGAPVTHDEYVKMLYAIQKNPNEKAEIIEALRTRGIGFVLTDGLRDLTRTKGANDEDLKRTLEEADHRRRDPEGAKLPAEKDATEVLEKARTNTIASLEVMPDFVVKQVINRSGAYAGTGNWRPLDTVIIAVSYSTEKGEQYKVLSVDGALVQSEKSNNYSNLSGSTTGGEFVEALDKLFNAASKTTFKLLTTDTIRNQPSLVFEYEIALENNKNGGVGFKTPNGSAGYSFTTVPAGEKGKVWIDRKAGRVLKIEFAATQIPADFKVKAYESTIDYDWVTISDEKFLLPILSDNRFTTSEGRQMFQDRNLIRFKNYQRYGTEVKILDDDTKPEPTPKKPN